jgi:hypothetical protein
MKNTVFWDVTPCTSCVNRHSSETSVHTRTTRRQIPENDILRINILLSVQYLRLSQYVLEHEY